MAKEMKDLQRDSIDFGTTKVTTLFRNIFIPTLLGMVFTSLLTVADGIFVGKGVGSEALAAVNIVAPFFTITTGLALMFGVGASVVASIHLARGNNKAANINVTQAFEVSTLIIGLLIVMGYLFPEPILRLFGSSDILLPYAKDYLLYLLPACLFMLVQNVGMFVIRLDGAPKFASLCNIVPGVLNVIVDYIFVFPMRMGIKGSSLATSICCFIGAAMALVYMAHYSKTLHFYPVKFTRTSLYLTARNVGYMMKTGFSAMLNELSLAVMLFTGNYVFLRLMKEDGVAAYSVACYLYPIVFMVNNAVAQSAQPIISLNHGVGNTGRVKEALKTSLTVGIICGLLATLTLAGGSKALASLFLALGTHPHELACFGIPRFALSGVFFAINIVMIGYYQAVEDNKKATLYTLLRGVVFLVTCFLILPLISQTSGPWFAVPVSEMLTAAAIGIVSLFRR